MEAKRALQFIVSRMNLPIKTFIVSEKDYEDALEGYKGLGGEVSRALGDLEMELSGASSASVAEAIQADLSKGAVKGNKIVEDAPVTKIVAVILRHALEGNASDIHIGKPSRTKSKYDFAWMVFCIPVLFTFNHSRSDSIQNKDFDQYEN